MPPYHLDPLAWLRGPLSRRRCSAATTCAWWTRLCVSSRLAVRARPGPGRSSGPRVFPQQSGFVRRVCMDCAGRMAPTKPICCGARSSPKQIAVSAPPPPSWAVGGWVVFSGGFGTGPHSGANLNGRLTPPRDPQPLGPSCSFFKNKKKGLKIQLITMGVFR